MYYIVVYYIASLLRPYGIIDLIFRTFFFFNEACLEMNDYEKAQDYLTLAQAKKPFDPDINTLLKKLAL